MVHLIIYLPCHKERLQTKRLINGDYKMADEGWTHIQDGGSPIVSLMGEEQRNNGGAHTFSSLISNVGEKSISKAKCQ